MSPELLVIRNFFIALMIGALVGVEREKRKAAAHEAALGGLRTFILFAEAGAVSAWLSSQLAMPWLFILTVVAVAMIVTIGYVLESRVNPDSLGLTTELAAVTVCLLGGAVMYGYAEVAVGLAIVTASVLAFKQPLHGVVDKLGMDDIYAALKLLIATFIVLPILPQYALDPWGALNPYELWLLVIVVSSLSLIGYVAVRWLGRARGTLVAGLAGGLASSTAVSLAFARESRTDTRPGAADALAAGILIAWTVMFVRVVFTVAVVNRELVAEVAIPSAMMAAVAAIGAAFFYFRQRTSGRGEAATASEVPLTNPFSLWAAVKFGFVFAAVLLVVKLAYLRMQAQGLYVVAAIAGLTDVDAITMGMARSARQEHDPATAVTAIVIAALANSVAKYAMVVGFGSSLLRWRLLPATAAVVACGVTAIAMR
ncbi:MAG: MgtC/SapB family protein [Candidatus Binatia bacterium]